MKIHNYNNGIKWCFYDKSFMNVLITYKKQNMEALTFNTSDFYY